MRATHDPDFAYTLMEVLQEDAEAELEPVILFEGEFNRHGKGACYWIGDGNHRVSAYHLAGRKTIPAIVYQGGREAAFRHALGANADQRAKPRTRKDLRRAVMTALNKLYFEVSGAERATQAQIAELCKTSQVTVHRIIRQMEDQEKQPEEPVQMDFWEQLSGEFDAVISHARQVRENPRYLQWTNEDPKQAVEGLTAIADALQHEYREIRRHVEAIREGMAKS